MAHLHELTAAANDWLHVDEVPDFPPALNGLQLENGGEVRTIVAAVDACLPVVEAACSRGADLLVVHHGLFWAGAQPIRGSLFRKLKRAMDAGLAIYSVHIPLDVHPVMGNNARLVTALGLDADTQPFAPWKGIELGLRAETSLSREELVGRLTEATGCEPHLCAGGPETVREVGVITGGAGSQIADIAASGVDTFITGEGPHWSYTAAEELGINLLYGGHYATETFGVKALAEAWCEHYEGLEWDFIDHPTGL